MQDILGYSKWDNFHNVIDKAKNACDAAGEKLSDHCANIGKMVDLGSEKKMLKDVKKNKRGEK